MTNKANTALAIQPYYLHIIPTTMTTSTSTTSTTTTGKSVCWRVVFGEKNDGAAVVVSTPSRGKEK